jgi:hypothetical protein
MNVSAIDTLEMSKALTAVGFTDQQAEALTRQLRLVQNIDLSNLAKKDDLRALATELRAVMAAMRAEMAAMRGEWKAALAENKADIIKWVIGIGFAQAGLVVALIKLIH